MTLYLNKGQCILLSDAVVNSSIWVDLNKTDPSLNGCSLSPPNLDVCDGAFFWPKVYFSANFKLSILVDKE